MASRLKSVAVSSELLKERVRKSKDTAVVGEFESRCHGKKKKSGTQRVVSTPVTLLVPTALTQSNWTELTYAQIHEHNGRRKHRSKEPQPHQFAPVVQRVYVSDCAVGASFFAAPEAANYVQQQFWNMRLSAKVYGGRVKKI